MLKAIEVALYFLKKDEDGTMFDSKLVTKNGSTFYAGNARLNKYLHLAQIIYIAKTGNPLIDAEYYAYNNGAVVLEIQERYQILLKTRASLTENVISSTDRDFLDRFFEAFRSADLNELIELSHDDPEWVDKNRYRQKSEQRMNLINRTGEYIGKYMNIVTVLDRMKICKVSYGT